MIYACLLWLCNWDELGGNKAKWVWKAAGTLTLGRPSRNYDNVGNYYDTSSVRVT